MKEIFGAGFKAKHMALHVRYPWLPGVYLIVASVLLAFMWKYKIIMDILLPFVNLYLVLAVIGPIIGIYVIIRYLANPEEARRRAEQYSKEYYKGKK